MASRTFTSNSGNHRLTISTILTHAVVFHEAGYEITTEIRRRVRSDWWNPFSWSRYRWDKRDDASQPYIAQVLFIQGVDINRNPDDFAVSLSSSEGYRKVSCIYGNIGSTPADLGNDARSVNNISITFGYNGITRTLRHSDN
jgi:hypothetical protein